MELGNLAAEVAYLLLRKDAGQGVTPRNVVVENCPHVLVVPGEQATVLAPDVGEHPMEAGAVKEFGASAEAVVVLVEEEVGAVARHLADKG